MEDRFSYIIDNIQNWLKEEEIQYNSKKYSKNLITFWCSKDMKLEATLKNEKLTISWKN